MQVKDESRGGQVIDHVGYTRAFFELFEGAIYMHQVLLTTDTHHHKGDITGTGTHYTTSAAHAHNGGDRVLVSVRLVSTWW